MAYEIRDICTPRAGKDGKTFWHRIGTAFIGDDGKIGLAFDSLPIADAEGRVAAQIFRRQDKNEAPARQRQPYTSGPAVAAKPGGARGDMDDDILF